MKSNSIVRVNLALPKDLADWVKEQAKNQNRSVNNFIQTILLEKKRKMEMIPCISTQS